MKAKRQWEVRIKRSEWNFICRKIIKDNGFMHLGRIRGFSGFITTSHFKAKPSVGIW